jgi:hypothetical protein
MPDWLSSDSTLTQVAVLVRFVGRSDSAATNEIHASVGS